MIKLGIYLAEKGLVPDFILNFFIQRISLARVSSASIENEKIMVINNLKSGPIAERTSDANDQHYEVPPAFFELVLGKHMKYSCSQFDSKTDDLDKAEESMLQLYIDRAGIQANQTILDLGCGWGSFSHLLQRSFQHQNLLPLAIQKIKLTILMNRLEVEA